jgi:hypothetical protein
MSVKEKKRSLFIQASSSGICGSPGHGAVKVFGERPVVPGQPKFSGNSPDGVKSTGVNFTVFPRVAVAKEGPAAQHPAFSGDARRNALVTTMIVIKGARGHALPVDEVERFKIGSIKAMAVGLEVTAAATGLARSASPKFAVNPGVNSRNGAKRLFFVFGHQLFSLHFRISRKLKSFPLPIPVHLRAVSSHERVSARLRRQKGKVRHWVGRKGYIRQPIPFSQKIQSPLGFSTRLRLSSTCLTNLEQKASPDICRYPETLMISALQTHT